MNLNIGTVDKLVDKISSALGGCVLPMQLVRVAKAEAQATEIKALADANARFYQAEADMRIQRAHAGTEIEVTELQKRAAQRWVAEETQNQLNMESIAAKALPLITEEAKPEDVEDDWLREFFENCRMVSNEEMQQLWAKLLAGEVNQPGTFSKRTLNTLRLLGTDEAELFTRLCKTIVRIGGREYAIPLDGLGDELPAVPGELHLLASAGLIIYDANTRFEVGDGLSEWGYWCEYETGTPRWVVQYFDQWLKVVSTTKKAGRLPAGHVMLTQAGAQLSRIVARVEIPGYLRLLADYWQEGELRLTSTSAHPPY